MTSLSNLLRAAAALPPIGSAGRSALTDGGIPKRHDLDSPVRRTVRFSFVAAAAVRAGLPLLTKEAPADDAANADALPGIAGTLLAGVRVVALDDSQQSRDGRHAGRLRVLEIVQLDTDDSGRPRACSAYESESDGALAGGTG